MKFRVVAKIVTLASIVGSPKSTTKEGYSQRGNVDWKGTEIINHFMEEKYKDQKVTIIGLSWGGVLVGLLV
ncbi:MAG: hypothetical protein ACRBFS_03795 [Aureispira sp.]